MSYIISSDPFRSISGSLRGSVGRFVDRSIGNLLRLDLLVPWAMLGQMVMYLERFLCFVSDLNI